MVHVLSLLFFCCCCNILLNFIKRFESEKQVRVLYLLFEVLHFDKQSRTNERNDKERHDVKQNQRSELQVN